MITGGAGFDSLVAGIGDDTLDGGADDDWLEGAAGAEVRTGGTGNDTPTGGFDSGQFVFPAGDGADRIEDFEAGLDHLVRIGGITVSSLTESDETGDGGLDTTVARSSGDSIALRSVEGVTDPLRLFRVGPGKGRGSARAGAGAAASSPRRLCLSACGRGARTSAGTPRRHAPRNRACRDAR